MGRLILYGLGTLAFMLISVVDFLWTTLYFLLRKAVRRGGLTPVLWKTGAYLGGRIYWVAGVGFVLLATLVWFMVTP